MTALSVETLVQLATQLSEDEQLELLRRLQGMHPARKRPSQTLHVFEVEGFLEDMTLRREDEYSEE